MVGTRAKRVMIGAYMATRMGITKDDLEPWESCITAVGALEAPRSWRSFSFDEV